jgi:hypothetical protein
MTTAGKILVSATATIENENTLLQPKRGELMLIMNKSKVIIIHGTGLGKQEFIIIKKTS